MNDDNIDKFFKNKFNGDITPESWNTPDAVIWEKIEYKINKKESQRSLLFPWIISGILSCGLIMMTFAYIQQKNQSHVLKTQLDNCQTLSSNIVDDAKEYGNDYLTSIAKDVENTQKPPFLSNTKNRYLLIPTAISDVNIQNTNDHIDPDYSTEIQNTASLAYPMPFRTLVDIPFLPISTSKFIQEKTISSQISLYPTIPSKETISKPYEINGAIGINQNIAIESGKMNNPLSEFLASESYDNAFIWGIGVGKWQADKWFFSLGAQYGSYDFKSRYNIYLPYDKKHETEIVDGQILSEFSHSLPSARGNINTDLTLTRSQNTDVDDGDIIPLDVAIRRQYREINIPMIVRYAFDSKDRGFMLRSGLNTSILLHQQLNLLNSESHHANVSGKSLVVGQNTEDQKTIQFNALLGLQHRWQINKSLFFDSGMDIILPLRATYTSEQYEHYNPSLNYYISIAKQF